MKSDTKAAYEVGYGKPPAGSRFQKGQSGNPNGRPKGTLNFITTFNRALKKKVTVTEGGRRVSMTKLDAAVNIMINKALKGDARALQQVVALSHLIGIEPFSATGALDANDATVMAMLIKRFGPDDDNSTPEGAT
jgi:hypothetical protein